MGLSLTVGNPSDVFEEPFAGRIRAMLVDHFGDDVILDSTAAPYRTPELAWSGWGHLQGRASEAVGDEALPHFLSMEAWRGCFIPAETEPGTIEFDGEDESLNIASLKELIAELELAGRALKFPVENEQLREFTNQSNEEGTDADVQTYVHLLLAARIARSRRQVLWVVK